MKLCFIPTNPKLNAELIESQYPAEAIYDNVVTALTKAKGLSNFLSCAAALAHESKHELNYDDIAAVADSINTEVEAALLMFKALDRMIADTDLQA